nr:PREDICTED: uncharacterized protein LOC105674788 [Linepithema humile]
MEDADLKGEEIFDQIATASENVGYSVRRPNADSNLEEQLPSAPSAVDASVHYENSNGFVPMIPSASPSHDDPESSPLQIDDPEQQDSNESEESDATIVVSARGSSETQAEKKFEEDLAYSSEARIFLNDPGSLTNRRSFDFQEGKLNEFELLKVNNDTPAVANYQQFYENVRSTVNTNGGDANGEPVDASSSGRTSDGKRTESYAHNYVRPTVQSQQVNEEDPYAQFYSYNNMQDMKKTTYEQEKVAGNYHPQDTVNHNAGHGQNAAPTLPSSSRTNYEVNELANSGTYDNIAEQSRARHRFSRPVVVAESTDFSDQAQSGVSDNDQRTSRNLESSNSEESGEYSSEYIERPRIRIQKSRRRPYPDTSRKLPKEHRGTTQGSAEEDKQKYNPAKLKSQRYRIKTNPWVNDPSANQDESVEDIKHTDIKSAKARGSKSKHNAWNQISPNLEISHSNGIELDHTGKPKYVVNLVPVASFDHATALDNSQGFDMSNAMLQNIVTAAPVLSTPVPDIIVGQNSFQSPVHTVFVSQPGQNGKDTLRATYLPSTMTPVFAVTSSLNPTLHNVRLQNNVTPRTAFTVTPAPTSVVQQLLVPQPTVQTYSNFLQTPLQTNSGYQIQLNPHGLQGQSLFGHGNLQGLSTEPTTLLTGSSMPEGRNNVDSQNKKNAYTVSGGNILTTASMTVGQNDQKTINGNSYYLQNHNAQVKDIETPRTKTYVQATQMVPTLLQIPTQQDAKQYIKLQSGSMEDAVQQLQAQINKQLVKNTKLIALQSADNAGSHSNNVDVNALTGNAHLPNVVTKNVEIVNPNIKPSPIDTTMNAYYPTAVLTTPIPIFSTISPVTQTVALQNYVNSLTESGAKAKHLGADLKTAQNQERPMFNPINFVPNIDILKNQNTLNNKPTNEHLQQGLSLVPVMPGGNFFRPSLAAQSELVAKPKLTSDLQKYAEEMFKESLKTMYNSQKWNNDRRPQLNNQNGSESDIAKLRLELQKLRASLSGDSRFRDILEAHQSENIHSTDTPKSSDKKKQDPLIATLEQLLKTKPRGPIHIFHGVSRPGRKRKPGEPNFSPDFHDDFTSNTHTMEFLTPPRNHFHSKGPYHEKLKKRPIPSRYKNGPRKPIRPSNSPPRNHGLLDASASTINIVLPDDDPPYNKAPFEHDNLDSDSRHQPSFDRYPTFTTSSPETIGSFLRELKTSKNRIKDYDINHPRMHNLLGLLMKNKQLPTRSAQNYFRNKDQLRQYFESEKHRLQQQYYEDMRDYLERSDMAARPGSLVNRNIYINGTA